MELRSLRYFAAVVEAGSISAAATALRLSQPSLSTAMARLESDVGVALLERSSRGVEPTSAGRYLLGAASRVLGDVAEISATLTRFGRGVAGTVTFAAVPALMWRRVPELLRRHATLAPDVEVTVVDPPPWTAVEMVRRGEIDVAAVLVAEPRRFAQRLGDIEVIDCGAVPLRAALPAENDIPPGPVTLGAFEGRTLVLAQPTAAIPSLPEVVTAALRVARVTPAAVRTTATIQAGVPLIEAGLAWGVLPDFGRRSLERFDLDVRDLVPEPGGLHEVLIVRPGARAQPVITRFLRSALLESATDTGSTSADRVRNPI